MLDKLSQKCYNNYRKKEEDKIMEFIVEKIVDGEIIEVWQGATGTIYFVKKN